MCVYVCVCFFLFMYLHLHVREVIQSPTECTKVPDSQRSKVTFAAEIHTSYTSLLPARLNERGRRQIDVDF